MTRYILIGLDGYRLFDVMFMGIFSSIDEAKLHAQKFHGASINWEKPNSETFNFWAHNDFRAISAVGLGFRATFAIAEIFISSNSGKD